MGAVKKERRICHSRRLVNAVSHSHGRVARIKKAQPISAAMEDSRKKILIRFAFFFFFYLKQTHHVHTELVYVYLFVKKNNNFLF